MTFKPRIWYPIALALSALNLVAAGYAMRPLEPAHAGIHVVLALAFGFWAGRLRQSPPPPTIEHGDTEAQLDVLEDEVSALRRELGETQERLDFAERMLAQGRDPRGMGPPR